MACASAVEWTATVEIPISLAAYERVLQQAREQAIREMAEQARERAADAVLGLDFDYEVLGARSGMLMVTCAGTAVTLRS